MFDYTATNNNEWGVEAIEVTVTYASAFPLQSKGAATYSFNSLGL
jgi:hypothetical protein